MGYMHDDMRVWNPHLEQAGSARPTARRRRSCCGAGHCSVHQRFRPEHIDAFREAHPGRHRRRAPRGQLRGVRESRSGRLHRLHHPRGRCRPEGSVIGRRDRDPPRAAPRRRDPGEDDRVARPARVPVLDDVPHRRRRTSAGCSRTSSRAESSTRSPSTPRPLMREGRARTDARDHVTQPAARPGHWPPADREARVGRDRAERTHPIFVAGHRGLVGSAVLRRLEAAPATRTSSRRPRAARPARPGGGELLVPGQPARVRVPRGGHGRRHPGQLHPPGGVHLRQHDDPRDRGARGPPVRRDEAAVPRQLVHLPARAPQPITRGALLTGPLEPTNEPYAIAKIAGIKLCQSYRRAVRLRLHLGDADEPLRPERQLRSHELATCCRR